mmetsp:Transcript_4157/g.6416  ORF Transcript_4157/g.6416 Transcript_4157/m.6416 type:complete len:436 (+) Transcript_4157:59-1366(+)
MKRITVVRKVTVLVVITVLSLLHSPPASRLDLAKGRTRIREQRNGLRKHGQDRAKPSSRLLAEDPNESVSGDAMDAIPGISSSTSEEINYNDVVKLEPAVSTPNAAAAATSGGDSLVTEKRRLQRKRKPTSNPESQKPLKRVNDLSEREIFELVKSNMSSAIDILASFRDEEELGADEDDGKIEAYYDHEVQVLKKNGSFGMWRGCSIDKRHSDGTCDITILKTGRPSYHIDPKWIRKCERTFLNSSQLATSAKKNVKRKEREQKSKLDLEVEKLAPALEAQLRARGLGEIIDKARNPRVPDEDSSTTTTHPLERHFKEVVGTVTTTDPEVKQAWEEYDRYERMMMTNGGRPMARFLREYRRNYSLAHPNETTLSEERGDEDTEEMLQKVRPKKTYKHEGLIVEAPGISQKEASASNKDALKLQADYDSNEGGFD